MTFSYPENVSFTCNGCGLCCGDTEQKTRHILLLESEAEAISEQIGHPIEDFAEEISGTAPYVYQMKKPQKGKCFFLENNRCSVYESRPLICRFFPFALKFNQDSGKYVFSYTLECPTVNKGKAMAKKDFEELFALANERLP